MNDTCDYIVLSTDPTTRTAAVKFLNPFYSGNFIAQEDVPVEVGEGEEPRFERGSVDRDPNPHMEKWIAIPFNTEGVVDVEAFRNVCADQARGVRNRMDAVKRTQTLLGQPDLTALHGLTSKVEK